MWLTDSAIQIVESGNEDGELVCNCPDFPNRPGWWGD